MNSVSSYFAPQPKRRGLTLRTAEALRTGSAASDQGSRRAVLSRGTNLSSGAPSNGISGHLIWPALRYRMARCAAASATRPVPGRDGFPEAWVAAPLCGSACAVASTIAPQPPLPALGRETRRPMSSQVVRLHRIRPTPARSALSGFGRASGGGGPSRVSAGLERLLDRPHTCPERTLASRRGWHQPGGSQPSRLGQRYGRPVDRVGSGTDAWRRTITARRATLQSGPPCRGDPT